MKGVPEKYKFREGDVVKLLCSKRTPSIVESNVGIVNFVNGTAVFVKFFVAPAIDHRVMCWDLNHVKESEI